MANSDLKRFGHHSDAPVRLPRARCTWAGPGASPASQRCYRHGDRARHSICPALGPRTFASNPRRPNAGSGSVDGDYVLAGNLRHRHSRGPGSVHQIGPSLTASANATDHRISLFEQPDYDDAGSFGIKFCLEVPHAGPDRGRLVRLHPLQQCVWVRKRGPQPAQGVDSPRPQEGARCIQQSSQPGLQTQRRLSRYGDLAHGLADMQLRLPCCSVVQPTDQSFDVL